MNGPRRSTATSDLMRFTHLGVLGVFAIGGGFWLGLKVDAWLDTSPWLSLGTALFGAAGWMLVVVREASTLGGAPPNYEADADAEASDDERS